MSLALVTGASRGIGRAIALELARTGARVACLARTAADLEALAGEIRLAGGGAETIICDLADPAARARAVAGVRALGELAILVNNAGLGGPFHRADEVGAAEWDSLFALNVTALRELTAAFLPAMKARGFGRVINIASIQGLFGGALSSTYAATKHAVVGYTRSVAAEWGHAGITCNAVCPGYIATEMLHKDPDQAMKRALLQRVPAQRFGRPEEIAALVRFLAAPEAGYINGAALVADGGLSAHLGAGV